MTLERLLETKKWRFRRVPLGELGCPSGLEIIVFYDVTKQARVTSINLVAPGLQQFELVEIDLGPPVVTVILEPYFLAAAGMIVDARTFDNPIAWIAAGRRIAIRIPGEVLSCAVSGLARAGMNIWELTG